MGNIDCYPCPNNCSLKLCFSYDDFRSKTMQLERLKVRIIHQMETIKTDDEHLRDYKSEIDHLKREKLMHIESLRLIERDITMVSL